MHLLWKLLYASVALAQGIGSNPPPIQLANPLSCSDFGCIGQAVIGAIFAVAIPVTSIMVLIGGFQIMTAGGNEEKFSQGRRTLIYAAIGFGIILISGGVVSLIRSLFP